ncbi:hypothetical protein [Sphingosinicella rhizophila]|uniref:Protein TonB n=1 Tax=Sphingosinicella rhizophila TaxID=3050082 RepID=A0ABU3QBB9_9SPHN|nr:hypothetical protein [Sphingosinicella sp. GR2756]MDT9600699.1 hypothetical protein [Sphingosinicella sp. GR2756]
MHPAFDSSVQNNSEGPFIRRRAISLALTIAAEILLILALLTLNGPPGERSQSRGPVLLDLTPEAEKAPPAKPKQAPAKPKTREMPPVPVPPPPVKPPPIPSKNPLPYFIPMTKEELAASDISKFRNPGKGQGDQQASAPGDSEKVGTAPNGEPMYAARWYREPTDAELGAYLPARMPPGGGWGIIACKTVSGYRVEDCVELANSPPGSHLAGAVRQAAWQFRVRPPRVGGKELVGTWVRIRIDYGTTAPE